MVWQELLTGVFTRIFYPHVLPPSLDEKSRCAILPVCDRPPNTRCVVSWPERLAKFGAVQQKSQNEIVASVPEWKASFLLYPSGSLTVL